MIYFFYRLNYVFYNFIKMVPHNIFSLAVSLLYNNFEAHLCYRFIFLREYIYIVVYILYKHSCSKKLLDMKICIFLFYVKSINFYIYLNILNYVFSLSFPLEYNLIGVTELVSAIHCFNSSD